MLLMLPVLCPLSYFHYQTLFVPSPLFPVIFPTFFVPCPMSYNYNPCPVFLNFLYTLSFVCCPLSIVPSQLSPVRCPLSVVPCPLSTVRCLLSIVHCLLSHVKFSMTHIPCSKFHILCLLSPIHCCLHDVPCPLSVVSCPLFPVRFSTTHIPCSMYMDDIRAFLKALKEGWRWWQGGLYFCKEWQEQDKVDGTSACRRTADALLSSMN